MTTFLLGLCFAIGGIVLLSLVAVVRGPTTYDRFLATSLAVANSVAILLILAFTFDRPELFFDIGLSYALLAFLFPLAFTRFLGKQRHTS